MAVDRRLIRRVAEWVTAHPVTAWNNDWGETLQLYGLLQVGQVLSEPRYVDYVREWLLRRLAAGLEVLPAHQVLDGHHYRYGRQMQINGYCGSWGANLIVPHFHTEPQVAAFARRLADYILYEAARTAEGGLKHGGWIETYWVDTLYYSVPGLAMHAAWTGADIYRADAAKQLLCHAGVLQSPSGLFYHCCDQVRGWRSAVLWGRGNGWVLMSGVEWLSWAPPDDPWRVEVEQLMRSLIKALVPLQGKSGLWHTVLDDPSTYEEVSATAMFAFGLARAVQLGLVSPTVQGAVSRAVQALSAYVTSEGAVTGVSGGTDPGDPAHYRQVPVGTYPWGTGAWLLAMAEAIRAGRA